MRAAPALQTIRTDLLATSRRLNALGPRTLGQDLGLVRSPIWQLVSQAIGAREVVGAAGPLAQVEGPALTVGDQRVFAELFTRWTRRGFPDDYSATFSLTEMTRALGITTAGPNLNSIKAALRRLCSAVFVQVQADGEFRSETGAALLASYAATDRPRGLWCAVINTAAADMLLSHPITFLDAPTWDALLADDPLAARLWVWLEGERITTEWRWSLFRNSSNANTVPELRRDRQSRRTTAIAEILRIDHWARQRKQVERIRAACAVIGRVDSTYTLAVTPSVSDRGNFTLHCIKTRGNGRTTPPEVSRPVEMDTSAMGAALPAAVRAAWHAVSPTRLPSATQLSILRSLIAEWGATPVVDALCSSVDANDPFGILLERVEGWRTRKAAEWDTAKQAEMGDAAAFMATLRAQASEPSTFRGATEERLGALLGKASDPSLFEGRISLQTQPPSER